MNSTYLKKKLAKTFNEYFVNVLLNLGIKATNLNTYENHSTNNIALIILKY